MDAYAKSTTPENERDRRGTPKEIFDCISDFLNIEFTLDVCADAGNYKVRNYLSTKNDSLSLSWQSQSFSQDSSQSACWMNPPYSNPYPWCKKASEESSKGVIVVGLLPDDRSTAWFQEQVYKKASAIYTTTRRIAFLDENGVPQNGNPKGSIVVVWTTWRVDSPAQGYIDVPRYNQKTGEWIYG